MDISIKAVTDENVILRVMALFLILSTYTVKIRKRY